jgi:hypothetical protein
MKTWVLFYAAGVLMLLTFRGCAPLEGADVVSPTTGGYVFYDKGSYSSGWRFMECAPINAGEIDRGGYTDSDSDASVERAQALCADFEHGGKSDWFLPANTDMRRMLDTLPVLKEKDSDRVYYITSDGDLYDAYDGTVGISYYFSGSIAVRPVQRF